MMGISGVNLTGYWGLPLPHIGRITRSGSDNGSGIFEGAYPSRGISIYQGGGKILEKKFFRGAEGAAKIFWILFRYLKILSTFFESFGKFVNKNAIKKDFWGIVGRYISNISKNSPFWGENTSTNFNKFWDTSTKVPIPPKYPCKACGGGPPGYSLWLRNPQDTSAPHWSIFFPEKIWKRFVKKWKKILKVWKWYNFRKAVKNVHFSALSISTTSKTWIFTMFFKIKMHPASKLLISNRFIRIFK